MIARTWNVFHGKTSPPGRRSYLREMIELVTADRPGVVCLQEVPVWALDRVAEWAAMRGVGDRARRAHLPVLGRHITGLHAGHFRSGLTGQGNVILFRPDAKLREHKSITLNTNPFCEEQARKLGLDPKLARRWERERRICQVVKIEFPSRQRVLVANLHATSVHADPRLADAELRRAANFVDRQSEVEEVVILAGDFNVTPEQSTTIASLLALKDEHWSQPAPLIDHVLVRNAETSAPRVWQLEERTYDGKLLSDHAPVEVDVKIELDRRE
jgi:endonuclease/exonuclease/phosphatase family metal-dependent hydrolase